MLTCLRRPELLSGIQWEAHCITQVFRDFVAYDGILVLWECLVKKLLPLQEAKVLLTIAFVIHRPHLS